MLFPDFWHIRDGLIIIPSSLDVYLVNSPFSYPAQGQALCEFKKVWSPQIFHLCFLFLKTKDLVCNAFSTIFPFSFFVTLHDHPILQSWIEPPNTAAFRTSDRAAASQKPRFWESHNLENPYLGHENGGYWGLHWACILFVTLTTYSILQRVIVLLNFTAI